MYLELTYYVFYAIFALHSIFLKAEGKNILVWVAATFILMMIVHLKVPMWDIEAYEFYANLTQLNAFYLQREIVYFKTLQILTALASFKIALLVFDVLVIACVFRTFKNLNVPLIYWYTFFISFICILGYQNIHRQFIASVLFMWLLSALVIRNTKYRSRLKPLLAFFIPFIHNVAAVALVLVSPGFLKKLRFIIIPAVFFIGIFLVDKMAATKSGQASGINFALVYFIFLNVLFLIFYVRHKENWLIDKLFIAVVFSISSILFLVSILTLSVAGQERVGLFFLIVFFPYLMLGARSLFKQKKVIDLAMHLLMHIPIYFTNAFKFLVT